MLDKWTVTDADETWDFRVEITADDDEARPEQFADMYDADLMLKECGEEAAQWARDAVKTWEEGSWQFATVQVTPVMRASGFVFESATQSVSRCDYGFLPGGQSGEGTWTDGRDYVRTAWANDLISEAKGAADEQLAGILETAKIGFTAGT